MRRALWSFARKNGKSALAAALLLCALNPNVIAHSVIASNDLCQAVRAGNTVYVRGQVGTDFDGQLVGLGQIELGADFIAMGIAHRFGRLGRSRRSGRRSRCCS